MSQEYSIEIKHIKRKICTEKDCEKLARGITGKCVAHGGIFINNEFKNKLEIILQLSFALEIFNYNIKCKNCKQFYSADCYIGKKFKGKTFVKRCIKCRIVDKNGCNKRNKEKINLIQTFLSKGCAIGKCPTGRKATECDHIDAANKKFKLSDYKLHTIDEIMDELKKCNPICRFCHSIKTKNESYIDPNLLSQDKKIIVNRSLVDRNRKYVIEQKIKIGECEICKLKIKIDWIYAFHFNHYGDGLFTKINDISTLQSKPTSLYKIQDEIDKCNLCCVDCHFDITQKQLNNLNNI
jgi:cytochrome c2